MLKIKQFALELSPEQNLTIYHFVYGIYKLLQMNATLRDNILFKTPAEKEETKKLADLFEQQGLLTPEMAERLSLIAKNKSPEEEETSYMVELLQQQEATDCAPSSLVEKLLAENRLQLDIGSDASTQIYNNKLDFQTLISKTKSLYQQLNSSISGQDTAVRQFVQGYFQGELLRESDDNHPRATFLFSGPEGAGKVSLAQEIAKSLELPFLKIELSEFSVEQSALELVASMMGDPSCPPSLISTFVDKHPRCVILFNELDKCNPKILSALGTILECGSIEDRKLNKTISFKDTLIIFTATLGSSIYAYNRERNLSLLPKATLLAAFKLELSSSPADEPLETFIRTYFASGNLIMFNYLSLHHLSHFVKRSFREFTQKIETTYGITVQLDENVEQLFFYSHDGELDASSAASASTNFLKNEFYELGRHLPLDMDRLKNLRRIKFQVELPSGGTPLRSLFVNEQGADILLIADKTVSVPREGKGYRLHVADSYEEARDILKKHDIICTIIDIFYGQNTQAPQTLSLDDIRSTGISCLEKLQEKLTGMPFFLIEREGIDPEDKNTFLQRGVRQFLRLDDTDASKELLNTLVQDLYQQDQYDQLNNKGKVLSYNTAQTISADGSEITITFYDFHTRTVRTLDNTYLNLITDMQPKERLEQKIGSPAATKEIKLLSEFLTFPRKFVLKEGQAPTGVLLFGLPETGKAYLAKALAGESNAAFISLNAISLLGLTPEAGINKLEGAFACAQQCAPAVIFLEELDKIACTTTTLADTYKNIILDNLEKLNHSLLRPVLFVGSVNWDRSYISSQDTGMDATLLRRLNYKIYVSYPTKEDRQECIRRFFSKEGISTVSGYAVQNIIERTPGMSIAMLKDYLSYVYRNAKRAGEPLSDKIFLESLDEFEYGEKNEWTEEEAKDTAVHESGHAYLNWINGKHSSFITIISRENFGGYTMEKVNEKGDSSYTKQELVQKIRMLLAGRAAEIVFFGKEAGTNTGISSDLQKATRYALAMICYYGMDEGSLLSLSPEVLLQSPLGGRILESVSKLLQKELVNTIATIREGKPAILELSNALLAKSQLTGPEIDAIFDKYKKS